MFTDLLNIPIDRDRASYADQILCLAEMTWNDYEQLIVEDSGYRISYWQGVISIVSPSKNHERIAEIISGLIKTFCRKYSLAYFSSGSTTLKKPPVAGKDRQKPASAQDARERLPRSQTIVLLSRQTKLYQIWQLKLSILAEVLAI